MTRKIKDTYIIQLLHIRFPCVLTTVFIRYILFVECFLFEYTPTSVIVTAKKSGTGGRFLLCG